MLGTGAIFDVALVYSTDNTNVVQAFLSQLRFGCVLFPIKQTPCIATYIGIPESSTYQRAPFLRIVHTGCPHHLKTGFPIKCPVAGKLVSSLGDSWCEQVLACKIHAFLARTSRETYYFSLSKILFAVTVNTLHPTKKHHLFT